MRLLSAALAAMMSFGSAAFSLAAAPLLEPVVLVVKSANPNVVMLGETAIRLEIHRKGAGPVFFALHEDEATSIKAAVGLRGTLVILRHGGGRNVSFRLLGVKYRFDPNRIFTPVGIERTLRRHGAYSADAAREVEKLYQALRGLIQGRMVVGLHNNKNGGYSVNSYAAGGEYAGDAARVHISPNQDEDDFVLTTSAAMFERAKQLGYNAVLQKRNPADDGSLSVYCASRCVYLNAEAEHGHTAAQRAMLRAMLQ